MKLTEYIEYIKNLNLLSKLDVILLRDNGTVTVDFIKYSKHKFIQKRRNEAREVFMSQILQSMKMDSDFQGPEKLIRVVDYYFYAVSVWIEMEHYFLCMGPFYIAEHISTMIEPDLPYYKTLEIKMAARLFQMCRSRNRKGMFLLMRKRTGSNLQEELEIRRHRVSIQLLRSGIMPEMRKLSVQRLPTEILR